MSNIIKIGLAQINPVLGDLAGNTAKIIAFIQQAAREQVDILVFPELAISGYPPQDLWWEPGFVTRNLKSLEQIIRVAATEMVVILGFGNRENGRLYNAAAVIQKQQLIAKRYKTLLPNYDVFDEKRYFTPAETIQPVAVKVAGNALLLGIEICEDLWDGDSSIKVTNELINQGAELIVNLSASPFEYNKRAVRQELVLQKVREAGRPFVLVNLVGGEDELVFDGNSFVMDKDGVLIGWAGEFRENLTTCTLNLANGKGQPVNLPETPRAQSIFEALVLGVRDYCCKTSCQRALLGLSGGIDSALVACIAVEALGAQNVLGVLLPSRHTAPENIEDAQQLAHNLRIKTETISIEPIYQSYLETLKLHFHNLPADITEENIQARIRGNLLMAFANKFGYYLLSTGNKTELALGYCTLYGDMCGALAVISDLSKMMVYEVALWYNQSRGMMLIPERIFQKIPTAELAPGQVDPFDYAVVSPLVDLIINDRKSRRELIHLGYATQLVDDILQKIRLSEYKRHQAAPGLKVTGKAFGLGRRMPIINHYREGD